MQRFVPKYALAIGQIILWALVVLLLVWGFQQVRAEDGSVGNDEHLVTIYDQGLEQTIITRANTVAGALAQAQVKLDDIDQVEPARDTELVARSYHVNVYRARPILVEDGPARVKVVTAQQSPKAITAEAGLKLYDEDTTALEPVKDIVAAQGASVRLVIDRATPVVFNLYGEVFDDRTQARTVGEMLAEKSVELGPKDDVSPSADTPIAAGMRINVWRNGKQTVTLTEKVKMPIEEIQDYDHEVGYRKVKTPGSEGVQRVTYEIIMKNGVEISRKQINSVVTKKPVTQVEIVGAKVAGPAEIIERINYWSEKRGIDAGRVARIAKCESGFNPQASNGYHQGLFQHDPQYWPARAANYGFAGAAITDVEAQIAVSTGMMAEGGWYHWECQ